MGRFLQAYTYGQEERGILAVSFAAAPPSLPGAPEAPSFAAQRWSDIAAALDLGGVPWGLEWYTPDSVLEGNASRVPLWPDAADPLVHRGRFVAIAMWNGVAARDDASDAQIRAGVDATFATIGAAHERAGLPVRFAQVAYFSRNDSALPKGPETLEMFGDPAKDPIPYDAHRQAVIYDAILDAVARRPWIEGVHAFGYAYADTPLGTDASIRGKMAETVFSAWARALHEHLQ